MPVAKRRIVLWWCSYCEIVFVSLGDGMDQDIQRLFDERECEKLISEYCRLVDFGNAAGIAQLFVSHGIWTGPGCRDDRPIRNRGGFYR